MAVRPIDGTWSKFVWNLSKSESLARKFRDGKACLIDLRLAVEAQPTLTPPNEWVSVDKKLPQCGVPVLIGNPYWDYPVVASYAGSGVWMDSWHQKMTFTPTCWMPLPAPFNRRPPEGEEDI